MARGIPLCAQTVYDATFRRAARRYDAADDVDPPLEPDPDDPVELGVDGVLGVDAGAGVAAGAADSVLLAAGAADAFSPPPASGFDDE